MNHFLRKSLSMLLTLSLVGALTVPAAASEALGDDLTSEETLLNEQTQLSTNVFWSTSYSDLREENLITYVPNRDVTPIVVSGDILTSRSSVTASAKKLESAGYRVVAGINGDFYNVNNGLPVGIVVEQGRLRSTDGGYAAIGFREDGTAIIGKPRVKVTANLGYGVTDGGSYTEYVRQVMGVNKARVASGGIYLYTHDFNSRHNTGNTEAGVDVLCTIEDGELSIGDAVTLRVDRVLETQYATAMEPNQVVLSANLKSDPYHVDALRNIPVGTRITLTANASDERWNDVDYAVGALYTLVENGQIVSGLPGGSNPRTAVGQKADGTLVFYTIDGRKPGHSIGASMSQVALRLMELGCVSAICLDGGGSTTLSVTPPDQVTAKTLNRPSEGRERAVTNQIFLVADNNPSNTLSHFYVSADESYVLAGSKVQISAAAVDTNYIPMDTGYELSASAGTVENGVLTTPAEGGEITVTASNGSGSGSTTVHAVVTPDDLAVRDSSGVILKTLSASPGSATELKATAAYKHRALKADPEAFRWSVTGNIGTVDANGVFHATTPGAGSITVAAGGKSVTVPVTVSRIGLKTVEDFEQNGTIFDGSYGDHAKFSRSDAESTVRMGRGSGKLDYELTAESGYRAEWYSESSTRIDNKIYTSLNLWVYGDGSGNEVYLLCSNGTEEKQVKPVTKLDFTGWKQVSVSTEGEAFDIQGLGVRAGDVTYVDDGFGGIVPVAPNTTGSGTIYVDQIVASFGGTVDTAVPTVKASLDQSNWAVRAKISDAVDGILPSTAISVSYNGATYSGNYNPKTGEMVVALPGPGETHEAMRVTITAKDASGNIGRASVDIPPEGVGHKFTDINKYWGATYVDYLYTAGITSGYKDGSFRPNQNITRAQFSVMLYRYLKLDESKYANVKLPFADNGKIPSYAVPAIKALYTEGIINGSTGKGGQLYFNPDNALTRAQAATMIGRTQEKGYAAGSLTFTDAGKIPSYAAFYIQTMTAQGVIGGYKDGSFKPNNNITRGQMAKILYNLM